MFDIRKARVMRAEDYAMANFAIRSLTSLLAYRDVEAPAMIRPNSCSLMVISRRISLRAHGFLCVRRHQSLHHGSGHNCHVGQKDVLPA